MNAAVLTSLFEQWANALVETMTALPRAGSNRVYYRMTGGGKTAVGAFGRNAAENRAFTALAETLRKNGIAAPEIYGKGGGGFYYLQEDLGDTSLYDLLQTDAAPALLQQAVEQLARIQVNGAEGFDWTQAYPTATFDRRTIYNDLHYFKYNFLKFTGIEFDEWLLEDDFDRLVRCVLPSGDCPFLMYRDFQSRNIMVQEGGTLRFIDFQDARRGPLAYDLASFLFQARAGFSDAQRDTLLRHYIRAVEKLTPVSQDEFITQFYIFSFFRGLQTLGAYGFRGLFEKKSLFLQSIPAALHNLRNLIGSGKLDGLQTPYLFDCIHRIVPEKFTPQKTDSLTVTIYSFAFKNGYPDDFTGHGGGFVFDCRGLHNPGRIDEFKNLTGRDNAVAEYIEHQPAVKDFLLHIFAILDNSVANYTIRRFSDLYVAFGCTGGQHRSVYCAERTAAYLSGKYCVNVRLIHREQHLEQNIQAV